MPPTRQSIEKFQNSVQKRYKMMLQTVPRLVFERPGARIFWGWVDYQSPGRPWQLPETPI